MAFHEAACHNSTATLPTMLRVVVSAVLISTASANAAELATWLGGAGRWNDPTKWDTNPLYPCNGNGMEFDVVFGFARSDNVTLTQDCEINNLHFLDGTIDGGTFELTLNSVPYPPGSIWEPEESSGFRGGSPTMTGNGTTRIPDGGTLEIKAMGGGVFNPGPNLNGRTLVNAGNTFLTGVDGVSGTSESGIINEGEFDVRDADLTFTSFSLFSDLPPTFGNGGILRKSSGNSRSDIDWTLNNIDSGTVVVESGTLSLAAGGSSTGAFTTRPNTALEFSDFIVGATITHDLTGATFNNDGTMQFYGTVNFDQDAVAATIGGNVELRGNLTGSGDVTFENLAWPSGSMTGDGTTYITSALTIGGSRLANGRTLVNVGDLTLNGSLVGNDSATLVNEDGGVFKLQNGAKLSRDSGIVDMANHGTFLKPESTTPSTIQWAFENTGEVDLRAGTIDFQGGYTQTAGMTIFASGTDLRVSSGSLNLRGGILQGEGTIFANVVNVNGNGVLSPGNSPGLLSLDSNYVQGDGGTLAIEIGGIPAGEHDRIAVTRRATLGGTLEVNLIDEFIPNIDDTFEILTATEGIDGGFSQIVGSLPAGLDWEASYGQQSVTLNVVESISPLPGDFSGNSLLDAEDIDLLSEAVRLGGDLSFDIDGDNMVDHNDRVFWVEGLFGTFFGDADLDNAVQFSDFLALADNFRLNGGWAQGDFDGTGEVQFPDFLFLADNFGKSNQAAADVPEPSSIVIGILGLVLVVMRSRRTTRHYSFSSCPKHAPICLG